LGWRVKIKREFFEKIMNLLIYNGSLILTLSLSFTVVSVVVVVW